MKESKFPGIFEQRKGKRVFFLTRNLALGKTVYDERLIKDKGVEYREWNVKRSKLGSALLKRIKEVGIKPGDKVLYLGCAYGTTASHVSDIVGEKGFVFGLDFAPRVMRDFVFVCETRNNMAPLFYDANRVDDYKDKVGKVDVVYMDIAQKMQPEIFLKNIEACLKPGGYALIAIKARSMDVTRKPMDIFMEVRKKLEEKLKIIDFKTLEPFELDHGFFVCKKQ